MKIKVLGSISPYCKGGANCPGYLIDTGVGKILLDCGCGSSGNMSFPEDIRNLHIIISHYHKDHYTDLFAILYASLCHSNLDESVSVDIYIPESHDSATVCDYEMIKNNRDGVFTLHTYNANSKLTICGCDVYFIKTFHSVANYSVSLNCAGHKLVYSGDMGYRDVDVYCEFCKNAELFICESSFLSTDTAKSAYHLDAKEAALIARKANVKKLLLTHTWPEREKDLYLQEARSVFPTVSVAIENNVYTLS